jgi:molybdopterin-biosynthesis enzyme MoeA-like protein
MALILEGAETRINYAGAATAQRFVPSLGKTLVIQPSLPCEFTVVLADHIVSWLQATFLEATPNDLSVLTTQGVGESFIVMMLEEVNFFGSPVLS